MAQLSPEVLSEDKAMFDEEGYLLKRGLLTPAEVDEILTTFMDLHAKGPIPGYFEPVPEDQANGDVLKLYPRMMHPHRFNEVARRYMLHPGIMAVLRVLFGEEPLGAQTMFYFKPPGARGQALHQDNYYLKVEPGTCIAAWVAIDPSDEENGGLLVVPKTQYEEIQCPHLADPEKSFTKDEVDVPPGLSPIPVIMQPGDVLFFNGSLIHGSYPNTSKTRFRRSFIGHYVGASTVKLGKYYNPLYTADGRIITLEENTDAGPCGGEEFDGPH